MSHFEYNQYQDYPAKYGGICRFRSNPSPRYNCHGYTFASGRSVLIDDDDLNRILAEDGYREVPQADVLPGDIIVYYSDENGFDHSGFVIRAVGQDLMYIHDVVSKWGKYSEVVHPANITPYSYAHIRYYRLFGPNPPPTS
ncbi:MAG: hypothetical protein WBC97_01175 [Gemmatimonadales bacterium]